MTEQERYRFEQWKRSFGSNEALSQAVYRYNADPYWYGGPQEARYIKKGASEEAIEDYYWSVREDEERREKARKEIEEMDRLWAERRAREEERRITSSHPRPVAEKRGENAIIREWRINDFLRS